MVVRQKIKEQYIIYLSVYLSIYLASLSISIYLECLSICLPAYYHYLFFSPMELILDSLDFYFLCIKGLP